MQVKLIGILLLPLVLINCSSRTFPEAECVAKNPISDNNQGDPENAVTAFKKLFRIVERFKELNGRYPGHTDFVNFKREIIPGTRLMPTDLTTVDAKFSPRFNSTAPYGLGGNPFAVLCDKDSDLKARIPIMMTDLYVRDGEETCGTKGSKYTYGGVFVVLWNDGTIDKIKPGDMLCAPDGDGMNVNLIPGSPGNPASTLKMRDYYAKNEGKLIFPPKFL